MVVVLLSALGAPHVLSVTKDQLILLAANADGILPHTESVPPGSYGSDFERAWAILSKDMVHARYFDDTVAALRFYTGERHELSVRQIMPIVNLLRRLPPEPIRAAG